MKARWITFSSPSFPHVCNAHSSAPAFDCGTHTRPDLDAVLNTVQQGLAGATKQGIKWITASVGNAVRMYSVDEVLFFQAQDKYTRVVTAREEALIRAPLKELIGSLDPEVFWQVHRSAIVRVGVIEAVEKDEDGRLMLRLRGRPDKLPVSSAIQHRFRGM